MHSARETRESTYTSLIPCHPEVVHQPAEVPQGDFAVAVQVGIDIVTFLARETGERQHQPAEAKKGHLVVAIDFGKLPLFYLAFPEDSKPRKNTCCTFWHKHLY